MRTPSTAELVQARIVHWHREGKHGGELYAALAEDVELPSFFPVPAVCEVTGETETGLKQRRQRGQSPSFVRLSGRRVVYPRLDLFLWLKDRYVGRKSPRASAEYVRQPRDDPAPA